MKRLALLLVIWAGLRAGALGAGEDSLAHVWQGYPIELHLKTGRETLLRFDGGHTLHVPTAIAPLLDVAPVSPTHLVLTPQASFARTLAHAVSQDGGAILLAVTASPHGSAEPVTIRNGLAGQPDAETPAATPVRTAILPGRVALLRHAAQTLYAPARLIPAGTAITRLPAPALPDDIRLVRSHRGETWAVTPVAAFKGHGYTLTALEIVNQSPLFSVALDPRQVTGRFAGIAFQHTSVGPAGSAEDRTTLYLLSRTPFAQALREAR